MHEERATDAKPDPLFGRDTAFVIDSLVSGVLAKHRQSAILNESRTDRVLVQAKLPLTHPYFFPSISGHDQCMGRDEAPPMSSTHLNESLKGSLGRDKGASGPLPPALLPNYTLLGCGTEMGEVVFG